MARQNTLYLIIGVLAVLVVLAGVYVYQQESKPDGVEIKIDENGIAVEGN